MAKAIYQRNQKVWVESVGVWATIEKIVPVWAKGFDEPVRVTYDVGLNREFQAHELKPEQESGAEALGAGAPPWRLMRARNKWQSEEDAAHHPYPGTYPVVVTDAADWGGWRVPGAEYDRDPQRIEFQSRLIAAAPELMGLARELLASVAEAPEDAPPETVRLARQAQTVLRRITDVLAPPPEATRPAAREDVTLSETDA